MPSLLTSEAAAALPRTSLLSVPTILDRTDARLCHLDGLMLSKAWALRGCADALEQSNGTPAPILAELRAAADAHYAAARWQTDEYVGSHWLHSFALLALDGEQ